MIEVERKFRVDENVLKTLHEMGVVEKGKKTFTDVYYDSKKNVLTENNFWLRLRDETWELKSPAGNRFADEKLLTSSYKETKCPSSIIQLLLPILQEDTSLQRVDNFDSLQSCLEHYHVLPFATIVTQRQTFCIENLIIDIDRIDTGFCVGEVEVLLEDESQIKNASHKINSFLSKLGRKARLQVLDFLCF